MLASYWLLSCSAVDVVFDFSDALVARKKSYDQNDCAEQGQLCTAGEPLRLRECFFAECPSLKKVLPRRRGHRV